MNANKPAHSTLFYGSLLVLECLMWGVANALSKLGFNSISPMWCLALRYALSTGLFFGFFGRRIVTRFRRRQLLPCVFVSLFTASAFMFGFMSLVYTTATNSGFFMALAVIIAPFLSVPVLKQKLDVRQLVPVAIVIAGMYCISGGSFSALGLGELLAFLSSCSTAFMLTLSGKYLEDVDPIVLCAIQCIVCFLCCFTAAFIMEGAPRFSSIGPLGWGVVAFLAVGCTFLGYTFQNIALQHVSPAFGALTWCTEPLFTAIAAYFILDERMNLLSYCGAFLILAGTVIASVLEMKRTTQAQG